MLRSGFGKKHRWDFSGLQTVSGPTPEEEALLNGSCEIRWWFKHPHHRLPMTIATDWPLAGCLRCSPGMDESWKQNSPSPWLPPRPSGELHWQQRRKVSTAFFDAVNHWSNKTLLLPWTWYQGNVFHECYLKNYILREQSWIVLGTLFCAENWFCATSGQKQIYTMFPRSLIRRR